VSSGLIERMRESRKSPAVLKVALSHLRSRKPEVIVFIFEGVDDLGVYEVWVARIRSQLEYELLPGKGKDQLLAFRDMLGEDKTGLSTRVFFFLDRDFDGLKGRASGPDVFVHDCYSIENILVSNETLDSLLRDEFRCTVDVDTRKRILDLFTDLRGSFHRAIKDVTIRIYAARKSGIDIGNLTKAITKYVRVELLDVYRLPNTSPEEFIKVSDGSRTLNTAQFSEEFEKLIPQQDYRGKYEMQMFVKWMNLLSEDRCSTAPRVFDARAGSIGNIQSALSLRSLATRSPLPDGLVKFVNAAN
jgi:Protein of unknown function (DUF4435)